MYLPATSRFSPRFWFITGLVLFFVAISIQYSYKVSEGGSAIIRWIEAMELREEGMKIHDTLIHPNSPILVMILRPLIRVQPEVGALCWFYIKVILTFLSLYWVFQIVESEDVPFPDWAKAATVLLSIKPIVGDLQHGNVNLLILFLVVAALVLFRNGRDWSSGITMGLAIACKVTPLLFVPYFVWKRAWKALGGTAIGLVLFFAVVPSIGFGVRENAEMFTSWFKNMIVPFVVKGEVFYSQHNNQSLPGLSSRMLTHSPSFTKYDERHRLVPTEYHNIADWPDMARRVLVKVFLLLFALVFVWTCRQPLDDRKNWRFAAEFSLVVLGMLLFSERTWKHHCVTLVLPFAVLCYCSAVYGSNPWVKRASIGACVLAIVLMASTSTDLLPDRAGKLSQVYGAYLWAFLVLMTALVCLLRLLPSSETPVRVSGPGLRGRRPTAETQQNLSIRQNPELESQ